MKITESDIEWLKLHFPNLQYDSEFQKIVGELDFCASYDRESDRLIIHDYAAESRRSICDVFEIEIWLSALDMNGWPKVYEVGGKHLAIAKKWNAEIIDLHFYPVDASCCLGLKLGNNRHLSIKVFLEGLVIPFFYRLSYIDKFGLTASQNDLWGEYSHGNQGLREYLAEIAHYAKQNPSRNDLCPCGSGMKYKKCHLSQVEYLKRNEKETTPDATACLGVK